MIKVYKTEWYLNGKLITSSESGREFYSREKAVIDVKCRKPEWIIHRKMSYQKCEWIVNFNNPRRHSSHESCPY